MFVMMILSYAVFGFLDLKATHQEKGKYELAVYITLMAISWAIGTASGYVEQMPSPAEPIKQMVFVLMGK